VDLLVRPLPYPDESIRGYYHRLALSNGLLSSDALANLYRQGPCHTTDTLKHLLRRILPAKEYKRLESKTLRCSPRYILQTDFRCCPLCLQEQDYHRERWDYALIPFCIRHQKRLMEDPVGYGLSGASAGSCGVSSHEEPDRYTQCLMRYLLMRLGLDEPTTVTHHFIAFDDFNVDDVQKIIQTIGVLNAFQALNKPMKAPIKSSVAVAVRVVSAAATVLVDWPSNINKLANAQVDRNMVDRQISKALGYTYRTMRKHLGGRKYSPVTEAYARYVVSQWPEVVDKKSWLGSHPSIKCDSRYMSGTGFSKKVGMSIDTLIFWIRQGDIDGHIKLLKSGQRQVSVLTGQEGKADKRHQFLTLRELSIHLGVSKKSARSLLTDGIIPSLPRSSGGLWRVDPQCVEQFRQVCRQKSATGDMGKDHKTLNHVMRYYAKQGMTLSSVLGPMMDGRILYYYRDTPGIGLCETLFLEPEQLQAYTCSKKQLISIPKLASSLNIKQEVAYHLVNVGLIRSVYYGRFGRLVPMKSLAEFREGHEFLRDIARRLNIAPKTLAQQAQKAGIAFKSGPQVDGGRQYVLEKSACIELLNYINGASSAKQIAVDELY